MAVQEVGRFGFGIQGDHLRITESPFPKEAKPEIVAEDPEYGIALIKINGHKVTNGQRREYRPARIALVHVGSFNDDVTSADGRIWKDWPVRDEADARHAFEQARGNGHAIPDENPVETDQAETSTDIENLVEIEPEQVVQAAPEATTPTRRARTYDLPETHDAIVEATASAPVQGQSEQPQAGTRPVKRQNFQISRKRAFRVRHWDSTQPMRDMASQLASSLGGTAAQMPEGDHTKFQILFPAALQREPLVGEVVRVPCPACDWYFTVAALCAPNREGTHCTCNGCGSTLTF